MEKLKIGSDAVDQNETLVNIIGIGCLSDLILLMAKDILLYKHIPYMVECYRGCVQHLSDTPEELVKKEFYLVKIINYFEQDEAGKAINGEYWIYPTEYNIGMSWGLKEVPKCIIPEKEVEHIIKLNKKQALLIYGELEDFLGGNGSPYDTTIDIMDKLQIIIEG